MSEVFVKGNEIPFSFAEELEGCRLFSEILGGFH